MQLLVLVIIIATAVAEVSPSFTATEVETWERVTLTSKDGVTTYPVSVIREGWFIRWLLASVWTNIFLVMGQYVYARDNEERGKKLTIATALTCLMYTLAGSYQGLVWFLVAVFLPLSCFSTLYHARMQIKALEQKTQ